MDKTLDDYFIDWEGHVFGFGYGTGEQYTIPALKNFLSLCGGPDSDRGYDHRILEKELTAPVAWLLINILCKHNIIQYGTSPRFGWLTPQGERLRDFVAWKSSEELYELSTGFNGSNSCCPNYCNCDGMTQGRCQNPFW